MTTTESLDSRIRAILTEHGRLGQEAQSLGTNTYLYQVGMTWHTRADMTLTLVGAFDIEFPNRMLKRSVVGSVSAIRGALSELVSV